MSSNSHSAARPAVHFPIIQDISNIHCIPLPPALVLAPRSGVAYQTSGEGRTPSWQDTGPTGTLAYPLALRRMCSVSNKSKTTTYQFTGRLLSCIHSEVHHCTLQDTCNDIVDDRSIRCHLGCSFSWCKHDSEQPRTTYKQWSDIFSKQPFIAFTFHFSGVQPRDSYYK